MILIEEAKATLDDLYLEPGKAELIGGRIVRYMSTGFLPRKIARNIMIVLIAYAKLVKRGEVLGDNVGYAVPELGSGRESFSPDVSYYAGSLPANLMHFIEGPPTFAIEIRSECDYRGGAEADMAAKRADYFEAGTLVVWDVDTLNNCIHSYRKSKPFDKKTFSLGQIADAEPAVPGWRVEVAEIFGG